MKTNSPFFRHVTYLTKSIENKYGPILTVKELSEVLKIGRKQAYELINSGEIPSIRIGTSIRIPAHEVDKYVSSQTNGEIQAEEKENDRPDRKLNRLDNHI